MSTDFYDSADDGKHLFNIGRGDGYEIVAFTHALSRALGMPAAVKYWDQVEVDRDLFCALTEEIFRRPLALTFNWARVAAGFHEILRDEASHWEWLTAEMPNGIGRLIDQESVHVMPVYSDRDEFMRLRPSPAAFEDRPRRSAVPDQGRWITLIAGNDGRELGRLPEWEGIVFYELTVGLALMLGVSPKCMERADGGYVVEEEAFNRVVEGMAPRGMDFYFQWFRLAIAIHAQIYKAHAIWMGYPSSHTGLMNNAVAGDSRHEIMPAWLESAENWDWDYETVLPRDNPSETGVFSPGPEE